MVTFTSERVSPHIMRIIAPSGVCVYLVQGKSRAALLDTGFGLGDLKGYVDALAQTPYIVLLSHGHLDHAGGSVQFETVYLSERDWELEKWHNTLERRIDDVVHGPDGMPEGASEADFLPCRTAPYLPLDEGDEFDLGGVSVRPIAVPGHSAGSMVFLIPEDRAAVFGDACGEHTLLMFSEGVSIEEYREGLVHLRQYEPMFDLVLRNHGSFVSRKQILADSIELCGEILERRDAAIPAEFHGVKGMLARPENHPGKEGNIVYDPNNLYRKR